MSWFLCNICKNSETCSKILGYDVTRMEPYHTIGFYRGQPISRRTLETQRRNVEAVMTEDGFVSVCDVLELDKIVDAAEKFTKATENFRRSMHYIFVFR